MTILARLLFRHEEVVHTPRQHHTHRVQPQHACDTRLLCICKQAWIACLASFILHEATSVSSVHNTHVTHHMNFVYLACRVTHRLELAPPLAEAAAQRAAAEAAVPATPTPPLAGPAGPAVTPAAEQAAAQQAAVPAERQGPIAAARKRFKRLLSALVCGGHQGGTTDGHSAGCNH